MKQENKEHKNLRELIENNISDFNEFGILVPIITKPTKGSLGGKPTKSYNLWEIMKNRLEKIKNNGVERCKQTGWKAVGLTPKI